MNCTHCGTALPAEAAHCPSCGQAVVTQPPLQTAAPAAEQVYCVSCGAAMDPQAVFCPSCGTTRVQAGTEARRVISRSADNRGTIALIAEIVGGYFFILGLGHMYTGRWALGIGLAVVWWFVLGVIILGALVTGGILACLALPLYLGAPVFSGVMARKYALSQGQ